MTKANTVVLGWCLAPLTPDTGMTPMTIAAVDGVSIAGLLFDAGTENAPALLQVGPTGSSQSHATHPSVLSDVFLCLGGAGVGKATLSLVIDSSHCITDQGWLWSADHDDGVGWTSTPAADGLVVNRNNVIAHGLFVEQYQVIWNRYGGRSSTESK